MFLKMAKEFFRSLKILIILLLKDKVDTPTDWDASAIVPIEGMETQPKGNQ